MANLSLQSISAFLILDSNDGQRLLAKYYDASIRPGTAAAQRTFETSLHQKVRSSTTAAGPSSTVGAGAASGQTDILLLNPSTLMLYRTSLDLTFVLLAPTNENELLASAVLNAIVDAASILLHHQLEKRALLDSLDLVLLALDETIDDGCVCLVLDQSSIPLICVQGRFGDGSYSYCRPCEQTEAV